MLYHNDLAHSNNVPSREEGGEPNRDRGNRLLRNALRALPLLALGTLLEGCAAPSSSSTPAPLGSEGNPYIGGVGGTFTGIGTNDWISYASLEGAGAVGVTLDLRNTGAQTGAGGDTLSGIENVIGSAKNDNITGDAGNNTLRGGKGVDTPRW